jgi:hypothetical protein
VTFLLTLLGSISIATLSNATLPTTLSPFLITFTAKLLRASVSEQKWYFLSFDLHLSILASVLNQGITTCKVRRLTQRLNR